MEIGYPSAYSVIPTITPKPRCFKRESGRFFGGGVISYIMDILDPSIRYYSSYYSLYEDLLEEKGEKVSRTNATSLTYIFNNVVTS